LVALRDCLEAQIKSSGLPEVCCVDIVPGAVADYSSGKDFAWMRLALAAPVTTTAQTCQSPLQAQVEVGIMRCLPVPSTGRPLSSETMRGLTQIQLADMAAMRRAVTCCGGIEDATLVQYLPQGPEGAIYGGTWTAIIGQA